MLYCSKTGLLSAVALLSFLAASAEGAAVNGLIIGEIEKITLTTPGDVWSSGRIVVGGQEVIIPRNLLMDLPANRLTLQQAFAGAPPACVARGESGLAKSDQCNTSGAGGFASISANHTNSGDLIAGDVFLQKGTETETGVVSFINHTDGYFRLNGIAGSATTGVMVRFNDPVGRQTHQQGLGCAGGPNCSPDPRFTSDPDNYTLVYTTGYPLCMPSTVPRPFQDVLDFNNNNNRTETLVAQSNAAGVGDILCPTTNRVVAAPHTAGDSRRMAPVQLGDHLVVAGNFEIINGVRFISAWSSTVSRAIETSTAPNQPDYMFINEMGIDAPGFQNRRSRALFIGHSTNASPDVIFWTLHRDSANGVHEFPLATSVGCDVASGNPAQCSGALGAYTFVIKHDNDFTAGNNKKPTLNPCSHLRSDPRFVNDNICPQGGTVEEQFALHSPIAHEAQARTGRKFADIQRATPLLRTLDVHGAEAANGQYLFPMGINLGGIDPPEPLEVNSDAFDFPTLFAGIPWNLDRRLSPGGCIGPCPANPVPLVPFPSEGLVDPRTQANVPSGPITDRNFTSSTLNSAANRIFSFVSPQTNNFNGNQTVLAWPPVDPGPQGIVATPTLPGGGVFAAPLPQITSIAPVSGLQGATVAVVITGINIQGGTGPTIAPMAGITIVINSSTPTQINASFLIAANATVGPRNVIVTTDGGTSNPVTFFVVSSAPTLISIVPAAGNDGITVPVVLTGTGLNAATINAIAGVTVTVTATTATSVNATFVIAANAAVGTRNVTATTTGGTSNAVIFTINAPAPVLTSINPITGGTGTNVPVVLTGTDLTGGTINAMAGVTVAITSATATQINAMFIIAANATVGSRNVIVTTASGPSNALPFALTASVAPTLTSISPVTGNLNGTVPVVLTGTGLIGATINPLAGVTITVSNVTATQINATFVIAANAALGARNVTVTSLTGTSNAVTFTLLPSAPSLISNTPASGNAGTVVPVVLVGTNLIDATVDAIADVTVTITSQTATQINATFAIAANAVVGPRSLTVTNPNGTSNARVFTVNQGAPTLISIAPVAGNDGTTVPVVLTGTNLLGGTINAIAGVTISVQSVTATQINATFVIAANAAVAARNVTVTTPSGTSNAVVFTINPATPILTTIVPAAGNANATVTVAINGTNLLGATVDPIPDVTVTITSTTATRINATFAISAAATPGPRTVIARNAGGASNPLTFTVNAAAPTLTSIAPVAGNDGLTVPVVLTGTTLTGGTINALAGITITIQSVTDTQINATFVIAANAAVGPRNVTVTTPSGTTNAVTFTVNAAAAPTLNTIAPVSGIAGTTVPVVLSGSNLTGATVNAIAGVTITVQSVTATQINATFVIAANAATTARNVTVTTAGGTSNAVVFTITPAAPTLTSIAPVAGNAGNTVAVVLTGTALTGATVDPIAGVTVTVQAVTATQINATFNIALGATPGPRSVTVTTAGGTSNAVNFTVNAAAAPTLNTINPVAGIVGATVPVVLTGNNLTGATVDPIAGVTVTVTSTTATQINASFVIAANAAVGPRVVTVTTVGGTSNSATFTVNPVPAPTLATIAPASGVVGTSVVVTLTGANLTGATLNLPAGITVGGVPTVTATQITATFVIAANMTPGATSITATTLGGTSNAVTFTVLSVQAGAPTISTVNPVTFSRNNAPNPATLTGTNFLGATAAGVQLQLNGVTQPVLLTKFTVTATQITLRPAFVTGAPLTDATHLWTITVTTPNGTSNAIPFTLVP